MHEYGLYLESGPRRRKTMVHVLELLGCTANGPTTDDALAATPAAIEAYRRFLVRAGEDVDPRQPFVSRVIQHVTDGVWLGNGTMYVIFQPDLAPVSEDEVEVYVGRFHALSEELAIWAKGRTSEALASQPEAGRTAYDILLHTLSSTGSYLSTAVANAGGFNRIFSHVERSELDLPAALRQVDALAAACLRAATSAERSAVVVRPKETRTLRKAIRRMLEHHWEHLAELSRRPGGPAL